MLSSGYMAFAYHAGFLQAVTEVRHDLSCLGRRIAAQTLLDLT